MSMGQENQQRPPERPDGHGTALHRKAATGRAEHDARAMSLQKALRLSIAKTADELFDLAMATLSLRTEEVDGPELIQHFSDEALLILLEGPHRRRAALVLDLALVSAIVQQQTMGRVLPGAGDEPRAMTGTDAAMCAPFLDGWLERSEGLPEKAADRRMLTGFRFGARADDARQLQLAMEASDYLVCHIGVDIAAGACQGRMILCLPKASGPDLSEMEGDATEVLEGAGHVDRDSPQLSDTVLELNADLNVAIAQLRMPLHRLSALRVGEVLDLKVNDFETATILTLGGKRIGRGTLGQIDGVRALEVTHRPTRQDQPRRRASDRAGLEQEDVGGQALALLEGRQPQMPEPTMAPPELPDIPDLPNVTEDAEAPKFAEFAGISDLPDLPELGELPPLDEETKTGARSG
ncbi:MAG: hypothetical protein HKN30_01585 [Sulfitobacter sp.]|nr:hypothetical protein [Sulfitobacter sp.]